MANITAKDVAALRERTNCGMMDCKKALVEADGDTEKAIEILREKGLAKAAKKAGRIAAEGIVTAIVDEAKNVGVVLEVNSETDFVAKNETFQEFVSVIAKTIIDQNPADVEALAECTVDGAKIGDMLTEKIATIGENIKIRRFERLEGGRLVPYIHGEGRIGVIVKLDTEAELAEVSECGMNVALQVTAMNPQYLNETEVPAETVESEKKLMLNQVIDEGKPAQIAEKIVMGKMKKFFSEICLVDQEYVKNGDFTVGKYVESVAKEIGKEIAIAQYVRFEKGEGIEKREDNFADEVAGMIK